MVDVVSAVDAGERGQLSGVVELSALCTLIFSILLLPFTYNVIFNTLTKVFTLLLTGVRDIISSLYLLNSYSFELYIVLLRQAM